MRGEINGLFFHRCLKSGITRSFVFDVILKTLLEAGGWPFGYSQRVLVLSNSEQPSINQVVAC